jgi:hypothetical protein
MAQEVKCKALWRKSVQALRPIGYRELAARPSAVKFLFSPLSRAKVWR